MLNPPPAGQPAAQAAGPAGVGLASALASGLSLRAKVLLITFIAAVVPLLGGALWTYYTSARSIERAARESLRTLALRTAETYDKFFLENLSAIRSEARLPAFRKLLEEAPAERAASPAWVEATATLAVLAQKDWVAIDSYALVDSSGRLIVDTAGAVDEPIDPQAAWFTQPIATGQPFMSQVSRPSNAGESALYFTCPIFNAAGDAIGIIRAEYNAAVLQQLLCDVHGLAGRSSFAMLINDAGLCLAHNSSSSLIFQPSAALVDDQQQLARGLAAAGSDHPYFEARLAPNAGLMSNAAVAAMNVQPWYVICAQPQQVYLKPLDNQLRLGLLLGVAALALVLLVAHFVAHTVTAPVVRLSLAAQRLSAGDLSARAQVETGHEIGRLATSFNTMAAQLQQMVEDLEQQNFSLAGLNSRLRLIAEAAGKLAQRPPPFELGAVLLEELGRILGCRGGSLYLRQGDWLMLVHALDPGHAAASLPYPPPADSIFGQAIQQGQVMLVSDIGRAHGTSAGWDGYDDGSFIVFPLLNARRECLGLVALHNKTQPPLLNQDRELGALLVTTGTETLQAAQAAEALDRSQESYRRLVEMAQEGIITADATDYIDFVNPYFASILGYAPHEILGCRLQELCDPSCVEHLNQRIKERHAGRISSYELTLLTKTGAPRVFSITASPLYDENGQYEGSLGVCSDITERKQAEQALRESEARYRGYIDNAPDGVAVFDAQARILEMNRAGLELIGYTLEEARQLTILDLAPPDRRALGATKLQSLAETGRISVDAVMQRRDGQLRHLWLNGIRLTSDRYLGFVKDITELKETEQELADKHAYLTSIFAALTDRVVVLNRDLAIADANRAFLHAANLGSISAGNVRCWQLGTCPGLAHGQACPNCPARQTFQDGQVHQTSLQSTDPAGQTTYWDITASPVLDANGESNSVVLVIRDVTLEHQLEQQVREAQKMEAIGRLAGGIAHDFNNILVAIMAYTDLALDELDARSKAAEDIREVKRGASRAADLIKQILSFSRQGDQPRQPVSLSAIISEVMRLMRASLPATIELREQLLDDQDNILADPTQIHQVLMNLLTNAGQSMNAHGGVITVSLSPARIKRAATPHPSGLVPGSYLLVSITDQGHGIAPEVLEHIFEPFFTTKSAGQGTGLGLTVAHGIVSNHQGAILIHSTPGQGTTAQVYLPQARQDSQTQTATGADAAAGRERILLVDDEEALVQVGVKILTRLGYQVAGFTASPEALAAFRSDPASYDAIVTDQTMPQLSGSELAAEVLRIRPEIPIVLCTGYSEIMPEERARELGIALYMQKPYGMRELGAAVRTVLDGVKLGAGNATPASDSASG